MEPRHGNIPPGSAVNISVTLSLPAYCGVRQEGRIFVSTADSIGPELSCNFYATCTPSFRCLTTLYNFGDFARNEFQKTGYQSLRLIPGPGAQGRRPVILRQPRLECFSAKIEVDEDGPLLQLSYTVPADAGVYNDSIVIGAEEDDGDNRSFVLPLTLKVVDPFVIVPSRIHMRRDPESQNFESPVIIAIFTEGSADHGLNIRDSPVDWQITDLGAIGKNRRRFRLVCSESAAGAFELRASTVTLFDARTGLERSIEVSIEEEALD